MKNFLSKLWSLSRTDRARTLAIDAVSLPSFCRVNMLKLVSVLVILLTIGSGNAWGTDATFSWTAGGTMGANATGKQGNITLTGAANSASNAPAVTSNTLRLYAYRSTGNGASATFTADDGYQITAITVTSSNGGKILKYSVDGGSYSTFSWSSGSSTISNLTASAITLKNCQNSGKSNTTIQVASVVVTYESTGGGCDKEVSLATSLSNCTATFTPSGPVKTCSATASDRQVSVSITPTTGYALTSGPTVSGIASATISGSGPYTIQLPQNGNGTLTLNATCTAIAVTGVSLNKSSTTIVEGSTETLTATITPSNALDKAVTWSSNATGVATVNSSGVVTAVSAGNATITVTTHDGSYTATCTVTVTAAARDHFIDAMHSTTGYTGDGMEKVGNYSASIPTIADKAKNTTGTCQEKHYHFTGWVTAANRANPEGNLVTLDGNASNTTYYAVWEKEAAGGASSTESVSWNSRYNSTTNVEGTELTIETNVTVTHNKGSNNNACQYYTTGPGIRVYGGGNFVVEAPSAITAITLTFGTGDGSNTISADVGTYSNGSWSGSATTVTFSVGGSTGHRRIAGISVTYGGGTSYEDPKTSCTADPIDPTVTFSNGEYTVGGSALDLRTLWTSNSSGAVTYTVTNANGTGATIAGDGYSLSATTAGSCTVQASQAAVPGVYNAISRTATITVNPPTCATPTFNNGTGTYNNDVTVAISCATGSSTIHYTTGASPADPTCSSGSTGTSVTINATGTTLKAVACKDGFNVSAVASATYTLKCATPTISVPAGTYSSAQSVTLACTTDGATIKYTTDGRDPATYGTTYSSAIAISDDATLKVIATKTNYVNSDLASAAYVIKDCDWYESFDNCDGAGGNSGNWSGYSNMGTPVYDHDGWTVNAGAGKGDKCIKAGTNGTRGTAQTPSITVDNATTYKLSFRMAPWNSTTTTASFTLSGGEISSGVSTWTSASNMSDGEWNDYQVSITTTSTSLQITFTTGSGENRFWLDEVCLKGPSSYTVTFNANGHGTAPDPITDVAKNATINASKPEDPTATGWTFGGWYKEEGCTNAWNWTTDQVTSNTTLYAKWTCSNPTSLSISSTGSKYDFCAGESMTLTVSGSNIGDGATYQWKLGGADISGAKSASYTTTMAAAKAGEYTCTVSNGSCSQTTSGFWVRVWQLYIDNGAAGAWQTLDFTNTGTGTGNNTTIELSADGSYHFKLKDNNGGWFGLNDKTVTATESNITLNGTGNNVNVNAGLGGNYSFEINYTDKNYPKVSITYPTANQPSGRKIWFDKSVITGWTEAGTSDLVWRIGKKANSMTNKDNPANAFTLVPGTDRFYVYETKEYNGFEAWHVANNVAWSGNSDNDPAYDNHSIYTHYHNQNSTDVKYATVYQKYVIGTSGVTLVPTTKKNTDWYCDFWNVTKTDGMLTHTATITPPTNGTITIANAAQSLEETTTTADLPHRTILTVTATPAPGYQLSSLTVNGEAFTSGNEHILSADATIAATFTAKTITITWNGNGGTPSKESDTWVYNSSALASLPTASGNGSKIFVGWFTESSGGSQIDNVGGSNKPTVDVTYYAHWSDGNTVKFHAGVGSVTPTSLTQTTLDGAVAAFPTPTIDCEGWSFAGWKEGSAQTETTTNPEASLYAGGHTGYVPATATVNMYAVWKKTADEVTPITSTHDWDNTVTGWTLDVINITTNKGTLGIGSSKCGEFSANGAYVQFSSKVNVTNFSLYMRRESNNTKGTGKIQKSTDNSNWTDVETWSMSDIAKGDNTQKSVTFDGKTQYYVRFYYVADGSAIRYIDNVSITYNDVASVTTWTSTPAGCVPANQVKTPVISPDTEAQTGDVSVTITCATNGATIRYTTDGTDPSSSTGTVYSGAFTVSCSATVKAIAYKADMDDSEIASQAYTITVPTPTFSLVEGTYYDANQTLTLSLPTTHTGTVIKYTTNGDDPTSSSATYSSAISVTEGTTTIKAIGYNATCGTSSAVASATYIVRFGTDYTLVTDVNDLNPGDKIVFISSTATTSDKIAMSTQKNKNNYGWTNDYNINAGLTTAKIYPAVGAAYTANTLTLGGAPGAWTFYDEINGGKYLNCSDGGNLTLTTDANNNNTWTIAIASNIATITNVNMSSYKLEYNGQATFSVYSTGQTPVKIYSLPNPDPVIKVDASLTAFSGCHGIASDAQSFYISGKNLDGNIVLSNVAPLAGYEFCLTSGGTYTPTLELTPVSKTVAKTQVFVRLAAGATAGTKNGNLNAAVSANSLSTNIAVTGSVSTADTYTDQIHGQVIVNQCGSYYAPSCADTADPGAATDCTTTHYKFMGWINEDDRNAPGVKDDAWYIAHLITAGTSMTADGTNYYAVWAKEED